MDVVVRVESQSRKRRIGVGIVLEILADAAHGLSRLPRCLL